MKQFIHYYDTASVSQPLPNSFAAILKTRDFLILFAFPNSIFDWNYKLVHRSCWSLQDLRASEQRLRLHDRGKLAVEYVIENGVAHARIHERRHGKRRLWGTVYRRTGERWDANQLRAERTH